MTSKISGGILDGNLEPKKRVYVKTKQINIKYRLLYIKKEDDVVKPVKRFSHPGLMCSHLLLLTITLAAPRVREASRRLFQ